VADFDIPFVPLCPSRFFHLPALGCTRSCRATDKRPGGFSFRFSFVPALLRRYRTPPYLHVNATPPPAPRRSPFPPEPFIPRSPLIHGKVAFPPCHFFLFIWSVALLRVLPEPVSLAPFLQLPPGVANSLRFPPSCSALLPSLRRGIFCARLTGIPLPLRRSLLFPSRYFCFWFSL